MLLALFNDYSVQELDTEYDLHGGGDRRQFWNTDVDTEARARALHLVYLGDGHREVIDELKMKAEGVMDIGHIGCRCAQSRLNVECRSENLPANLC